ncbi:MAG: DUF6132 family protein [Bacteroidales bacterium]|nr:DUF6132 family protein [Bacteroidales bacterium]
MNKILKFIRREWLIFAGIAAGAIGGYLYWYFIGCESGSCPITSSPLNSSIYGALLGALLLSMFKKNKKNESSNKG